jgi:hypothetical protein
MAHRAFLTDAGRETHVVVSPKGVKVHGAVGGRAAVTRDAGTGSDLARRT